MQILFLYDLWSHATVALPPRLEQTLAFVLVTPGVHRKHHSDDPAHFDTNDGSILTVWDRALGTWRPPQAGPLRFGVAGVTELGFAGALAVPFNARSRPTVTADEAPGAGG